MNSELEDQRGPIAWMAGNPIAANLLMMLLFFGGAWAALNVQKEVEPEYQLDIVEINVAYPGAAPNEVETGIILPIESAVRGLTGIREITSEAREGRGSVTIELVTGTDRMLIHQDIDQAISGITTFPAEVERPEVRIKANQREVMELGLYGDVDPWALRKLGERLRDRLLDHPEITQVELGNAPEYVTHIEIPARRLRELKMTLGDVAGVIASSSRDVPAGDIASETGEILLRMKERKQWAGEFAEIPIASGVGGTSIALGDIAEIRDGFVETRFPSQFNGLPSIQVEIFRVGDQSPLEISAAVTEIMTEFRSALPESVRLRVDSSSADDYEDRLSLLTKNAAFAIVIVMGIVALFLELRVAMWVMLGMAASFVGGILLLPIFGVSINMISMFGFLVALGIVVDDAIVVGENIHEHRSRGGPALSRAIAATREIARPVTFTILTTIVAFVPLLFIPGSTGKYWWPLPAVVIVVLVVSLVEALFILPAHLGHESRWERSRPGRWFNRRQAAFSAAVQRSIERGFGPVLRLSLRYRYVTLTAASALLIVVGSYGYSGHMGMIMMPQVAAHEIECGIRLPVGTTPQQAARTAREVTASTMRMFETHDLHRAAHGVKTNVRGGSFIDVEIVMKPPDERDLTADDIIKLWRDKIGDIPGIHQMSFEAERGPGGHRQDIEIDLSHSNIDSLERATQALVEGLGRYDETQDVSDDYNKGKAQLDVTLLPEGRALGLTPESVGKQLRDAFHGALALRQLRGTNEIEVRVKLPKNEREDLHHFDDFVVRTPDNVEVPLAEIASVRRTEGFTSITRRDGRRVVTVSTDVEPKNAVSRVIDALQSDDLPALRDDFPGLSWSFEGSRAEMRESTQALWGGFGLAMLIIYSLLAVAFRSYIEPLIVLAVVPFGLIGAVIGHIMLGHDLSLMSLMGIIALSGVVVNDSLIMLDFAKRNRAEHSAFAAIYRAGIRRFRPIALTTMTTFGGLAPIIAETSNQANHLIPMAISLGFGIVFATGLLLLMVPCLYLVVEDFRAWWP